MKQHIYKVTFVGTNGDHSIIVESPLVVDSDNEQNANDIIDLAIDLARLEQATDVKEDAEDFRDTLDTYAIFLEKVDYLS